MRSSSKRFAIARSTIPRLEISRSRGEIIYDKKLKTCHVQLKWWNFWIDAFVNGEHIGAIHLSVLAIKAKLLLRQQLVTPHYRAVQRALKCNAVLAIVANHQLGG
jgi:hypothetical protein